MTIGKKTNEPFHHSGGVLITQVELNGGTAELHAKIGKMSYGKVKEFKPDDEVFGQAILCKSSCKFILTDGAVADAETI
jgi:hypothetical protein